MQELNRETVTLPRIVPEAPENAAHFDSLHGIKEEMKKIPCHNCQYFNHHIKIPNNRIKLRLEFEENEKEIKETEKILGVDTFERMIKVLQALEYIDTNGIPTRKLKIARLVCSGPEVLLMTELLTSNILLEIKPKEIPVILSLLCFTGRHSEVIDFDRRLLDDGTFSETMLNAITELYDTYLKIKIIEEKFGIQSDDRMTFELIHCIDQWCNGAEFRALYQFTERMEGSIVRQIFKIDRFIESMKLFAQEFNQPELFQRLEESLRILRRDIMNTQSLYLS